MNVISSFTILKTDYLVSLLQLLAQIGVLRVEHI